MKAHDERIRELEAELALRTREWRGMDERWHIENARAEKAEARVAELERMLLTYDPDWVREVVAREREAK